MISHVTLFQFACLFFLLVRVCHLFFPQQPINVAVMGFFLFNLFIFLPFSARSFRSFLNAAILAFLSLSLE